MRTKAGQFVDQPSGKRSLSSLKWLGLPRSEEMDQREKSGVWLVLGTWLLIVVVVLVAVFFAVRLRREFNRSHPSTASHVMFWSGERLQEPD